VVIHYEEALYQVYAVCTFTFIFTTQLIFTQIRWKVGTLATEETARFWR